MNILIAVGAFNALFLAILLQTKKNRVVADGILSLFLFLTSLAFALVFGALEYGRDGMLLFLVFSNFMFAPLFYLYVKMMVNPLHRAPFRDTLLFLPWFSANLYLLALLEGWDDARTTWFFGVAGFSVRSITYNLVYLLDLVSWVTIELPLMMSQVWDSMSENMGLVIGFSTSSLLVFYLGYHGFRQGIVYSAIEERSKKKSVKDELRYSKSGMSETESHSYKENLLKLMKEQRPYLNNNLTIRELASLVGLTEHNISEVINVGVGVSFFDFINSYRVTEFSERVVQPENENITLLALAMECGFSSKSSFNRIFKKSTGMTPSQFQKSPRGDFS